MPTEAARTEYRTLRAEVSHEFVAAVYFDLRAHTLFRAAHGGRNPSTPAEWLAAARLTVDDCLARHDARVEAAGALAFSAAYGRP